MLQRRIDQLEKENVLVKRKLDAAGDAQRGYTQSLQQQLSDARQRAAQEEAAHARTSAQLSNSRQRVTELDSQVSRVFYESSRYLYNNIHVQYTPRCTCSYMYMYCNVVMSMNVQQVT